MGIFQGENSPGGSLIGGKFPSGSFPVAEKNICEELSGVHALTLIFIRKILILQTIASVFSPPSIKMFCYGVEIFPYPLVQLVGYESVLIGYIEM